MVRGASARVSWLNRLTAIPTAPGREQQVIAWVEAWAARHRFLVRRDRAGNLFLSTGTASRREPVVAVAHLDHPALVVVSVTGREVVAELRGGVLPPYLEGATVEGKDGKGKIVAFSADRATVAWSGSGGLQPGDILRWHFEPSSLGAKDGILKASACDDLAGVAAALDALDRARSLGLHHFSVLLTRAEEVGFVGAIAACELGTVPAAARILSIECSRASSEAPVGGGPIIRVGDASSVFTADLTNQVTAIARQRKIAHQRKLMAGGSCEATAFAVFGWAATGLCLALNNYHNMVDIDGVVAGSRKPRLAPEEISLSDYRGLINLLVTVTNDLDAKASDLSNRLTDLYHQQRHLLS